MACDECTRQIKRQKARELIKQNKLKDAITLLESLPQTRSKLVLLSECYLQVDRLGQSIECVIELKNMMTSAPRPPVDDVMQLVSQFLKADHHVRAMALLFCATRLHKLDSKPNHAVVAIRNCTSTIDDVIRPMTKDKEKARFVELGLMFMDEMLRDLRSVEDATPGIRADMEARSLCDIGLSCRASRKLEKATECFKVGLRVMKKQFGLNSSKFQIFGHLSNNLAIVYKMQGQYGKSMSLYKQSLEAYEKAMDWESNFLKNKRLQSTRVNMALLRKKME